VKEASRESIKATAVRGERWRPLALARQAGGHWFEPQPRPCLRRRGDDRRVKYKLAGTDWVRSDLFQVVAFAAGYQAHGGAIVAFAQGEQPPPPPLQIGQMTLRHFVWRALESISPAEAGADLANEIEAWLSANGASTLAA
jgi:hypothetical protein